MPEKKRDTAKSPRAQRAPDPSDPAQPRYAWLRECLVRDIRSGKYPVGSLLPPENEIARSYGVSRHTVREATRALVDSRQISRHPGIGTIVCASTAPGAYVAALGSARELFEYTNATRLEVLGSRQIVADSRLAALLGCEPRSRWLEIEAFRLAIGRSAPISFSTVYLRPEFSDVEKRLSGNHPSIYSMLEQEHGQVVHAVRQVIEACPMPAAAARLLGVRPASSCLMMRRSYLDPQNRVLGVSSNLYAAERFKLETYWSQPEVSGQAGGPPPDAADKAPAGPRSRRRSS